MTSLVEVDGYVERLLYNTNVLDVKLMGKESGLQPRKGSFNVRKWGR